MTILRYLAGLPLRVGRRGIALLAWRNLCRASAIVALVYVAATAWSYAATVGLMPPGGNEGPIGGDYAAFYAAGTLVLEGDAAHVYDAESVRAIERRASDDRTPDVYIAFRNPPFYAALFAPLAALPPVPSLIVWTIASLAMLVAAVVLTLRIAPSTKLNWRYTALVIAGFGPVYFCLVDGQNATLSLLLYALTYAALRRGHDGQAGFWAALGLFKPQLFFVLPLIFAFSRRWRALGVYCTVAVVLGAVSVAMLGVDGLGQWLRILVDLEGGNAAKNAPRMHSLKAFFDLLLPGERIAALTLYGIASIGLLALLARVWWRSPDSTRLCVRWAATVLVALLIDPHLLDYDLTMLIVPALLLAPEIHDAPWWMLSTYLIVLVGAPLLVADLPVQLTVLVLLGAVVRIVWRLERSRQAGPVAHHLAAPTLHPSMRSSAHAA